LNISLEKTFDPKIKRKGDKGSPYLNPLPGEIKPKRLPFRRIEKDGVEMQVRIQETQIELNPSLVKIARRKLHSILSKAFSISIFRNINPNFPLLDLKVCNIS
jgi:hypothetical protein